MRNHEAEGLPVHTLFSSLRSEDALFQDLWLVLRSDGACPFSYKVFR